MFWLMASKEKNDTMFENDVSQTSMCNIFK